MSSLNNRPKISKSVVYVRNIALILILCNLLYFFFPIPPVIWRIAFVVLSLSAFFSKYNRPLKFEKVIFTFIILNLIYFTVSCLWLTPSTSQIGNILYSMSSFLIFPYLGRQGVLSMKFYLVSTILFFLSGIAYYYNALTVASETLVGFDESNYTNNASVIFLFCIPFLFYIKNDLLRYVLLTIGMFFLIAGVKRGNILAAIIPILLVVWCSFKRSKGSILKVCFTITALVIIYYLAQSWIADNDYFLKRLGDTLDGQSSLRDRIYSSAWNLWASSDSLVHIIFGYGFDGTINNLFNGYRAHSDWLEILVDYGLLGVILYLYIFISFFRAIKNQSDTNLRIVIIAVVFIWFLKSVYSMGFSEEFLAILSIPLGAALPKSNQMS